MAIALVQSAASAANGVGSITQAISSTGSGNLLITLAVETNTSVALTPSVNSGSAQGTFNSIFDKQPGTGQLAGWYNWNCAAGTTGIKVARASGTGQWGIIVLEFSGILNTSDPKDVSTSSTTNGDTGTTGTTTQANELWLAVYGCASSSGGAPTITRSSSAWSIDQNVHSTAGGTNSDVTLADFYQIVSSTGTVDCPASVTGVASNGNAAFVVTFKAGSSVPTVTQFFPFF